MGNIIIGYKNLAVSTAPTVVASTAHADHSADNLKIAHPSEFHRLTSLTGMYQEFDFTGTTKDEFFNLICPLYVTATAQRNLLPNSYYPTSAAWTATNCSTNGWGPSQVPVAAQPVIASEATEGSPVTHHMNYTYAFKHQPPRTMKLYFRVYAHESSGTRNSSIYINNVAITVDAHLDLTTNGQDAAYYSHGESGGMTLDSYSVGTAVNGWSKIEMEMTYPAGQTGVQVRLINLDASYSATYNGVNGYGAKWLAPQLFMGGDEIPASDFISDTTAQDGPQYLVQFDDQSMAVGAYSSPTYESDLMHLCHAPEFASARGWSHGPPLLVDESHVTGTNATNRNYALIEYGDPDHADGVLDVSNVYIGPYWQPTVNVASGWSINPAANSPSVGQAYGGQEYRSQTDAPVEISLRLGYESPQDALGEAYTMGVTVGQHSPILVVLNPDEPTFLQPMTIYGTLTDFRVGHLGWFSDRGDGTAGNRYEISMTVRELLP